MRLKQNTQRKTVIAVGDEIEVTKVQKCPNCDSIELKRRGSSNLCGDCDFEWHRTNQPEFAEVIRLSDLYKLLNHRLNGWEEMANGNPEDGYDTSDNKHGIGAVDAIEDLLLSIPDSEAEKDGSE